jgi:hypothetical protein
MATGHRQRPGLLPTLTGACTGLAVWLALRLLPFNHVTATVRRLAGTPRRPATTAETLRVLHAVDAGAALLPVRVACLERSLAAVVLLAARRRGITWCMGVRTPPLASHAWVTGHDGEPIGESSTTADYRTLLTISPVTTTNRRST